MLNAKIFIKNKLNLYIMNNFFDWEFYLDYNKDLKNNNINNQEKAWLHYIKFGIYENRIVYKKKNFDWEFYVNKYQDLKGISDEKTALTHYFNHGCKEGRFFNETMLYNGYDISLVTDNQYIENNNIFEYIKKYSANNFEEFLSRHEFDNFFGIFLKSNHIDFDINFYRKGNNMKEERIDKLLKHFHEIGLSNKIYHPKQLKNIYPSIKFINFKKDISVMYKDKLYPLNIFIKNKIYDKSFNQLSKKLIINIIQKINNDSSLLILVFIGNKYIGEKLIDKLITYRNIEKKFNISFCFHYKSNCNLLLEKINNNFENYSIYISKELGNDIIPTLLMYNHIQKKYKYKHVIKLQTKSYQEQNDELTDFLLDKSLNELLLLKNPECNCIGINKYYMKISDDIFNKELINKYTDYINLNYYFVIGTVFYCENIIIDKILEFIKNNDMYGFLLNNMYDNNRIVYKKSYPHFLERLFGIIR